MSTRGGSSGSGSSDSSDSSVRRREREVNPTQNLTGSLSAGTIGTPTGKDPETAGDSRMGADGGTKYITDIRPTETSIVSGARSAPDTTVAEILYPSEGTPPSIDKAGKPLPDAVDTTVTQTPTPSNPTPPAVTPTTDLGTTVTAGPRSDFSVVLAGQTGRRPDRSAARSNNFVSLVGGAGGLGRRTSEAKRTLIGGA